jgi:hypothetical protein
VRHQLAFVVTAHPPPSPHARHAQCSRAMLCHRPDPKTRMNPSRRAVYCSMEQLHAQIVQAKFRAVAEYVHEGFNCVVITCVRELTG